MKNYSYNESGIITLKTILIMDVLHKKNKYDKKLISI